MCYLANAKKEKPIHDYNPSSCLVISIKEKEIVERSLSQETRRFKRK